ncbi:uncharacterized protein LOC6571696 [Drosophila grimshawi]|uniref:GH19620 n=1 Tax=Drosophila grimshawi TaxID=7222 RepID=B4K3M1_DROGR|nr:uncharacterized protein LOC6571696 [Drosophila grimshawi]EDW04433.1 GH19620 [Drosophila grimshawi]
MSGAPCQVSAPCQPENTCPAVRTCLRARGTLLEDVLGPFPDEVIMTALDRILYCLGATRIYHQLKGLPYAPQASACTLPCPKPSCSSLSSPMSNTSHSKYTSASSKGTCKPNCACNQTSAAAKLKSTTSRPSRPRMPRVDFAHPVIDDRQLAGGHPTLSDRMKGSLSTATIAYSRLKSRLAAKLPDSGHKWLWTRLVHSKDGCHVYEVYKNSDVGHAPQKMAGAKEAIILFLVTPNGYVMPFETVSSF